MDGRVESPLNEMKEMLGSGCRRESEAYFGCVKFKRLIGQINTGSGDVQ